MESPKVTIIVPIFNVENYLKKCVDSILNQTLKNIEILLASDGPEACHKICDHYAAVDPRVKVIKNLGSYGKSVNHCIRIAKGEFIGIVESDDWISPDMYEKLYLAATKNNADIAKCGFVFAHDDKRKDNPAKVTEKEISGSIAELPDLILFRQTIWSAIYRSDFIKKNSIFLYEKDRKSYIDAPFQAKAFLKSKKITLIPEVLYYYYQDNPQQSMQNIRKFATDGIFVKDFMLTECPTTDLPKSKLKDAYIFHICRDLYNDYHRYNNHEDRKLFWDNAHPLLNTDKGKELLNFSKYFSQDQKLFIKKLKEKSSYVEYEISRINEYVRFYLFSALRVLEISKSIRETKVKVCRLPFLSIIHSEDKVYYKLFGIIPIIKIRKLY